MAIAGKPINKRQPQSWQFLEDNMLSTAASTDTVISNNTKTQTPTAISKKQPDMPPNQEKTPPVETSPVSDHHSIQRQPLAESMPHASVQPSTPTTTPILEKANGGKERRTKKMSLQVIYKPIPDIKCN